MSLPYSIGYSALNEALSSSSPMASIINQAGNIITASTQSVTFAVMEKGANFDSHFTASLVDGKSALAWPISGYTYFVIRLHTHIGDCLRRKASMSFLYDFYFSAAVAATATDYGFALLSNSIRDIVLQKLLDSVMCSTGEFALAKYRKVSVSMFSPVEFSEALHTYIHAFATQNATVLWNVTLFEDSRTLWNQYLSHPELYPGVFTLFTSRAEKIVHFSSLFILSTSFALAIILSPVVLRMSLW